MGDDGPMSTRASRRRRVGVAISAALACGALAVSSTATDAAAATGAYVGLPAPARVLDTRPGAATIDGQLAGAGLPGAGATTVLRIAVRAGVPPGATGVVLNLAAVDGASAGFVTAHACDDPRPVAANLNHAVRRATSNLVIVGLDDAGAVCLFTFAAVHLVVDVAGYFTGEAWTPVTPARLLDTRAGAPTVDGQSSGGGLRPAGSVEVLRVGGRGGVPIGAGSVVLNVAVDGPHAPGFVTVHACDVPRPNAANLNHGPGQTTSNAVLARMSPSGDVCIYVLSATHVVVDVAGWFSDQSVFVPLAAPARVLDTRHDGSTIDSRSVAGGLRPAAGTVRVELAGRAGIPVGASAAVLNVAVDRTQEPGFVTAYPTGVRRPNAANVNHVAGETVPNAVVARLGADGAVCLFTSGITHVVVDVAGYIVGDSPPAAGPPCPGDPDPGRAVADRPDDLPGPQAHLVYVLPADGEDRSLDLDGSIERSIALVQDWLHRESGGQRLRIDTFNGRPDITFLRLPKTDAQIESMGAFVREVIERGLHDAGQVQPDTMYLAYYDGSSSYACGGATYPPVIVGQVVALYLRGRPGPFLRCDANVLGAVGATQPAYFDIAMLHEMVHGLGLAAGCAPHDHSLGHVDDAAHDLMWTGPAPWDVANVRLDVGRDDYFGHGRADCPDLRHSAFLTPSVEPTWMPVGWGGPPRSLLPIYG